MNRTKDMTVGDPKKLITAFAMPILFSHIFQQLYSTADALIVGKYLGTDSLAAVSSSGPLIFLIISFFTGTASGAGIVISRFFGAGDNEKVDRALHTAVLFAIVAGAAVSIAGLSLSTPLLRLMKTDPDVLPEASEYFSVYFCGSIFVVIYNICTGALNAVGDSRRPLVYLVISSIVNIVLDIVFVGVCGFGVWSAALATVISQLGSVTLCLAYLLGKKAPYRLRLRKLRFHRDMLSLILRYGIPSGIQGSVIGLANVIVQSNINSFGKLATAAYGCYAKLEGFAFLPITCYTMALTTFVSQNLGAGKYDRAKKGSVFGIVSCVVMAEVIGVLMLLLARPLLSFFTKNQAAIAVGERQIQVEALFFCMLSFSHCIAAIMRGAGRPMVPMFVMLGAWCVLRVTYISVVVPLVGESWVIFSAYPLTWTVSSIVFLLFYLKSDWIHGFDKKERAPAGRT